MNHRAPRFPTPEDLYSPAAAPSVPIGARRSGEGLTLECRLEEQPAAGYTVEEVSDLEGFAALRPAWDDLLSASPDADFFLSYEWISTLIGQRWAGRPFHVLLVRSGGKPVGLAPLLPDQDGDLWCRGSLVVPIMRPGLRSGILASGACEPVLDALLSHLHRVNGHVPLYVRTRRDSRMVAALKSLTTRFPLEAVALPHSLRPVARIDGTWEEYLASRPGHVRTELRRKVRRLESAGSIRFVTARTPAECDGAMEDLLRVEALSWKDPQQASLPASGASDFYREVARRASERGWMRIYLLYLDSMPIAHVYGVAYRGQLMAMKTAYDEAYARLAPGIVLFARILEQARAEGIEELDFMGVASRWKREFATGTTHDVGICLYPSHSLRCRFCSAYKLSVRPYLKRRVELLRRNGGGQARGSKPEGNGRDAD